MAGYARERAYAREHFNIELQTCHVADIKRRLGLPMRDAPNRIDLDRPSKPCPEKWVAYAETAVRAVHGLTPELTLGAFPT